MYKTKIYQAKQKGKKYAQRMKQIMGTNIADRKRVVGKKRTVKNERKKEAFKNQ